MAAKYPEDSDTQSMSSGRSRSMEDLLTCLICTEPFENPKVLPCNHTFCSDCLDKYYTACQEDGTTARGTLPCPVCRQDIDVPENGIQGLMAQTEAKPGQLQNIASTLNSRRVTCDVCRYKKKDINACHHCTHCTINYCAHCSADHSKHALFQAHTVIDVHQMEHTNFRCEMHETEVVKFYCFSCSAPLCTICAVGGHKNHATMELHSALGNKKATIEEKILAMAGKVSGQEEAMMQLEDLQNIKEAALKKTKVEVERHVKNLIAQLNIRKQAILEELDTAHTGSMKQIELEKENVSFELANMKSLWKFAVKLTEPSQQVQLLAMHQDLAGMIDNIITTPGPKLPKECITMHMFMPKQDLAIGELQKCEINPELLGRVPDAAFSNGHNHGEPMNGTKYTPPKSQHRAMSPPPLQEPQYIPPPQPQPPHPSPVVQAHYMPSHSPQFQQHSPIPYDMFDDDLALKWLPNPKLVWKVDKVGSKTGEISEAYDVSMMPNGCPVVAEWMNHRIQVFDGMGNPKEVIAEGNVQPWGIEVLPDGHLVVTDEKDRTVKTFDQYGNLVMQWKKNMFGWPRGLCVTSTGTFVVSDTGHGKHHVSIHLANGKCVRQFGSQGSGTAQFHWPRYITVDHHDRIIISDSSNHCIKVFDDVGNFIFKFGAIGQNDGLMRHPRGVCVDPQDNIIVADQDNNRVSMFSPEGRFIRHILPDIHKPWGVALSRNGFLSVTQKTGLTLYKIFEYVPI